MKTLLSTALVSLIFIAGAARAQSDLPTGAEPIYKQAMKNLESLQQNPATAFGLNASWTGLIADDMGCNPVWAQDALGLAHTQIGHPDRVGLVLGFTTKAELRAFAKATLLLGPAVAVYDDNGNLMGTVDVCGYVQGPIRAW